MRLLLVDLAHQFNAFLGQKGIDGRDKATSLKWLRFYWGFCHQYHYDAYRSENLPPFLDKLREQQQSDYQQNQARQVMIWFYCLQPSLAATSGVLAPAGNLAAVSRNPDAALKPIALPSNPMVENATTSATLLPILAQCDSKRPSHPDSYKQ
jgi:hypothetical protein